MGSASPEPCSTPGGVTARGPAARAERVGRCSYPPTEPSPDRSPLSGGASVRAGGRRLAAARRGLAAAGEGAGLRPLGVADLGAGDRAPAAAHLRGTYVEAA